MDIKLFTPYKKQKEVIDGFLSTDTLFGICSAPRGSGKTLLAMNMILYWALEKGNRKTMWCAPVYNQAKAVYDQIVKAAEKVIVQQSRQDLNITFVNGSTLKFLSSDNPDTIRGFRFSHIVIDEAAFHKETAISQVILPTLNPSGKKCLMISTPKSKNHFYKWFIKSNKEGSNVVSFKIPLTECPYVQPELIEAARQSLPPDLFRQEFEAEFVDSSNDVFTNIESVSVIGMFDRTGKKDAYIGIDTGLSADKSVLTVMSPMGRVLWVDATKGENITAIANRFMNVMNDFNIIGGYIECNGIGKAMADLIIPYHRKVREFFMTQDRKTDVVRKLISDMETQTVELPSIDLCPELHTEFSTYTYKLSTTGKLSFSHSPGQNDDYLDSLMMANYARIQFMDKNKLSVSTRPMQSVKPSFGSGLPR